MIKLDSHIHLIDFPEEYFVDIFKRGEFFFFSNSSSLKDWNQLDNISNRYSNIFPFFGIHPWYVDSLQTNWLSSLENFLLLQQSGVGEIGIHKSPQSFPINDQIEVFQVQFELAIKLNCPVTIHCFKAWQELFYIFNQYKNKIPKFMIHSFNSSFEIIKQILKYDGFISLSTSILNSSYEKNSELIKNIPIDRLLIESDFPYIREFKNKNSEDKNYEKLYRKNIFLLYNYCSEILEINIEDLMEIIYKNGKIFTNR